MTHFHFTAKQERNLKRLYERGVSIRGIARKFHAGFGTVQRALWREKTTLRKPGKPRTYSFDETAFDNAEASEEAAYFVGLLMADGCVSKRTYGHFVSIALSGKDGRFLVRLKKFLKATHPLRFSKRRQRAWNSQDQWRFGVCSNRLASALAKYGVTPRKSLVAKVKVLDMNRHFWRGCIDGDGFIYVTNNKPVIGLVGSRPMVLQFAAFVRSFTETKAAVAPMNTIWRFGTKGCFAVQIIRHLYGTSTVALPRKLKIAKRILRRSR